VYHKIISHFGTQAALARALGVSRVAVTLWKTEGIPSHQAIKIERITGGKFKAVDIEGVTNEKS
jgi:DNA-binding transcriptional regulator YdaS (Cro superfamily)